MLVDLPKGFGNKIRSERMRNGMSVRQFCKKYGIVRTTLQNIEAHRFKRVHEETLDRLRIIYVHLHFQPVEAPKKWSLIDTIRKWFK